MRFFSFITVADLVREVKLEGVPRFSRSTFYRLLKKNKWPVPPRTETWRNFGSTDPKTPEDKARISVDYYKALIKKHYNIATEIPPRPEGLIDYDDAKQQSLI